MNKYYVYAHYKADCSNSIPFYIGKGSGNRCFSKRRSKYWLDVVSKHGLVVEILKDCMKESDAFLYEIEMIARYKRDGGCQCNFTLGGDGVVVVNRWWNKKISQSLTGMKRPTGNGSHSYKDVITPEELRYLYIENKMSSIDIANLKNVSYTTICSRLKSFGITARKPSRKNLSIYCVENDTVYQSVSDAARHLKLHRENISKVIKGIYKKTGGYSFKQI